MAIPTHATQAAMALAHPLSAASRYDSRARMKKTELRSSALPTTPVTASVWTGWTAKRREAASAGEGGTKQEHSLPREIK